MAEVTEKSLKTRCTELNMGPLKNTTFGIRADRIGSSYTVSLQYRDSTPPQILIQDATASEAAATVEGAAFGAAAVKVAGGDKPEFVTRETFIRQSGERCPKCSTKDIAQNSLQIVKGEIRQSCSCLRCSLAWNAIYRLDDYDAAVSLEPIS